jgi:hypothetical protein
LQAGDDRGGMRFLIDECLSIDLVSVAGQAGQEAQHVARSRRDEVPDRVSAIFKLYDLPADSS